MLMYIRYCRLYIMYTHCSHNHKQATLRGMTIKYNIIERFPTDCYDRPKQYDGPRFAIFTGPSVRVHYKKKKYFPKICILKWRWRSILRLEDESIKGRITIIYS